jgi:glucokinase
MNLALALDIGGTNVRVAIIDEQYRIQKVMTESTIIGDKEKFLHHIVSLIDKWSTDLPAIRAIACGVPGRVDRDGGIEVLPNIKIHNVPLKETLQERFQKPVFIRNDAVMAAIAEGNLGFGKNLKSSYFMTISTGIGAALIRNHRLAFSSEEVGHMLIPFQNQFYEFESLASGNGIITLANLHGLSIADAKTFFSRVAQQDKLAHVVLDSWLGILKQFFMWVDTYYQPASFILTGGVMKSKTHFWDALQAVVPHIPLALAQFGQDAGLIGASNVALTEPI